MSDIKKEEVLRERFNFDQVTHMMMSASLLGAIMDKLKSGEAGSLSLAQFCKDYAATIQSKRFLPFNPGMVLASLYLAILFVQQKWKDSAPNASPTDPEFSDWGLSSARIVTPKKKNPTIRYILRRIRNSLGHARVEVKWPPGLSIDEILSKVTLVFQDIDPNDQSNTFEAELSIRDAFQLAKKHHVTAGEYVAKRYGGTLIYDRDWISPSDEETKQEADR